MLTPESHRAPILTNALRSLLPGGADALGLGQSTAYWVTLLSIAWCAGVLLVFGNRR